jgi:hypothetical protein
MAALISLLVALPDHANDQNSHRSTTMTTSRYTVIVGETGFGSRPLASMELALKLARRLAVQYLTVTIVQVA